MRVFRIIVVVLVLIGFPLVSWIYLNKGLKWRLQAEAETAVKDTLPDFSLTEGTRILTSAALTGTFYIVAIPRDSVALLHMDKLQKQFGARKDFKLLQLVGKVEESGRPDEIQAWMKVACSEGCPGLDSTLFAGGYTSAIVDDSLRVRGRYHLSDSDDMRKLVKDMAVVLPIEKREQLELRRNADTR